MEDCNKREFNPGNSAKGALPQAGELITVIKRNVQGKETWRYDGLLIERGQNFYILEAYFDRQDMLVEGLTLGKGDRFVETYYTDRWYNIFEVHAREDDCIRGWYCNICCPVKVESGALSYVDLALDLLVFPGGNQVLLDQDEFERLEIPAEIRQKALEGLEELKNQF